MSRIIAATAWIVGHFFIISIAVLVIFYLQWFRIAPFTLGDNSDPTGGFIVGMILLGIFGALAFVLLRRRKPGILKDLLIFINVVFLAINTMYLIIYVPRIETSAQCNSITYYIAYGHPFGDAQWTYRQLTKWEGVFRYKSSFFGYAPGRGPSEIICDRAKSETNIVSLYPQQLRYTDGEHPRAYVYGASAQLQDHLYFLSDQWATPDKRTSEPCCSCNTEIYTLYECNSDYTGCNPLPISYIACYADDLALNADPATNEVSLVEQYSGNDSETLIFTYGRNPRCYVDGCAIGTKQQP